MKCRILSILMLFTISATIIESKTFTCKEDFYVHQCTITDVAPQDSIQLSNYYSSQINGLIILNSTMPDIPSITSISSINLNYLECNGCGFPNITKNSFSQLNNLETLKISFGSFEKLQENAFNQVHSLTHLNVSHGSIVEIDDNAFSDLSHLRFLDLSFNNITTITSNMFSSLKSLWKLSLSYNKIKILDEGLFMNNTVLSYVYLDHNEIIKIEGAMFSPQYVTGDMILSNNELTALDTANVGAKYVWADNNNLKNLTISSSVEYLSVDYNYIENVVCDRNGSEIKTLKITNNSLTELGCIGSLSKLTYLSVSHNNIGKLNQSSLATLTELKSLFLRSANISKLDFGVFSHQSNLKVLDISYNHMGNIALVMLLAARDLQELCMDGNNMTEFSYSGIKRAFKGLSVIRIGDNDFNCTFLAHAIEEMNSNSIQATVLPGNKVTNAHNVNGIGCQVKNGTSSPPWIPGFITNDSNTNSFNTMMWTLINQLNNITHQGSNRAQLQEINELNFQIDKNSATLSDVANQIEKLVKVETTLHSSQSNSHSDYDLFRNMNIILITLIVTFCIYKGYKFFKKDVPRIRRCNTTNTLNTYVEMDSSVAR